MIIATQGITRKQAPRGRSSFAGDIFKLVGGTASSHVIGIAAAPFLARLFSPEAFGVLAVFVAPVAIISLLACFRYELAIPLAESDLDAAHILWLCIFLVVLTTAFSVIAILFAGDTVWRWLNALALKPYQWLIPVNILLSGICYVLTSWSTRNRQFGRLTAVEVVLRISTTGLQLGAACAGCTTPGVLIATTIFGTSITTTLLGFQTCHESAPLLMAGLRLRPILVCLRRYCRFPQFSAGAVLLNAASAQMPTVLLSKFFSVATAGQ